MGTTVNRKAGFTLIEVLVAMFLMATAATALVGLRAQTIRATAELQDHARAQMVADTIVAEEWLRRDGVVDGETGTISMGRTEWDWVTTFAETGEPGLYQMTVEVRRAGTARILATREILKVTQ